MNKLCRLYVFALVAMVATPTMAQQPFQIAHVGRSASVRLAEYISFENVLTRGTGDDSTARDDDSGEKFHTDDFCDPHPRWYGQADALFFNRSIRGGADQVVVIDINAPPGNDTVLTTNSLNFHAQPGARFLFGYEFNDCNAVEFTYFGFWDANASATAIGNNNLAIPGDLGLASLDFFDADNIQVAYSTELHNAEANLVKTRCCCCGSVSLLAGFRYLELNEAFNINSTDLDTGTSDYNIRASNDLYGLQIGGRVKRNWNCWGLDVTGKTGIFYNDSAQSQFVTDFGAGPAFPQFFLRTPRGSNGDNAAFVGDINISLFRRLTDIWSVRAGYNLMWIEGVASAPGQLDFTNTPTSGSTVREGGGLFLHGASVGIQANW